MLDAEPARLIRHDMAWSTHAGIAASTILTQYEQPNGMISSLKS
jgi:hypothetical protein